MGTEEGDIAGVPKAFFSKLSRRASQLAIRRINRPQQKLRCRDFPFCVAACRNNIPCYILMLTENTPDTETLDYDDPSRAH